MAILTNDDNTELLRQELNQALSGRVINDDDQSFAFEFAAGDPMENEGGITIWRDIYEYSFNRGEL